MIGAKCFIFKQLWSSCNTSLFLWKSKFAWRRHFSEKRGQKIRNGRIVTSSLIQDSSFVFPGVFANNHLHMTLVAKQKASNLQVMFPYRVSQSAMPASCIPVA